MSGESERAECHGWSNRALPAAALDDLRRDSVPFGEGMRGPEVQQAITAAMDQGLQTRDREMDLGNALGDLR